MTANAIRAEIARLQEKLQELKELERGVVEVYPNQPYAVFDQPPREIRVHMNPITHVIFSRRSIEFWDECRCFSLRIKEHESNGEFIVKVVGE